MKREIVLIISKCKIIRVIVKRNYAAESNFVFENFKSLGQYSSAPNSLAVNYNFHVSYKNVLAGTNFSNNINFNLGLSGSGSGTQELFHDLN